MLDPAEPLNVEHHWAILLGAAAGLDTKSHSYTSMLAAVNIVIIFPTRLMEQSIMFLLVVSSVNDIGGGTKACFNGVSLSDPGHNQGNLREEHSKRTHYHL